MPVSTWSARPAATSKVGMAAGAGVTCLPAARGTRAAARAELTNGGTLRCSVPRNMVQGMAMGLLGPGLRRCSELIAAGEWARINASASFLRFPPFPRLRQPYPIARAIGRLHFSEHGVSADSASALFSLPKITQARLPARGRAEWPPAVSQSEHRRYPPLQPSGSVCGAAQCALFGSS